MEIREIQFVQSSPGLKGMPVFDLPEFAFIGRSNVGKSSLINMLCSRKGIAKVSGTPGKTRLINHFKVASMAVAGKKMQDAGYKMQDAGYRIQDAENKMQEPVSDRASEVSIHPVSVDKTQARKDSVTSKLYDWYLVDLPGYGWAKISKDQREKFEGIIRTYLAKRENLACTFVLIDSRLPAQRIDLEFLDWLGGDEISFIIVFTKIDKLSKTQLNSNLNSYRKALSETWEEIPMIIPVSSTTNQGKDVILSTIQNMLIEIAR